MNPFDSFYSMFGTTGIIALVLSLFFGAAALINGRRRKAHAVHHAPPAGPIQMSDPHSGAPVSGFDLPAPADEAAPVITEPVAGTAAPEPEPASDNPQFFRQLDARGVDVDASKEAVSDDYVWE